MSESTSETPVLDLLASMTADSLEASSLDPETLVLVRIAALVAVDAPAALVPAEPRSGEARSVSTPSRSEVCSPRSHRSSARRESRPRRARSSTRSRSRSRSQSSKSRAGRAGRAVDRAGREPPPLTEGRFPRPLEPERKPNPINGGSNMLWAILVQSSGSPSRSGRPASPPERGTASSSTSSSAWSSSHWRCSSPTWSTIAWSRPDGSSCAVSGTAHDRHFSPSGHSLTKSSRPSTRSRTRTVVSVRSMARTTVASTSPACVVERRSTRRRPAGAAGRRTPSPSGECSDRAAGSRERGSRVPRSGPRSAGQAADSRADSLKPCQRAVSA